MCQKQKKTKVNLEDSFFNPSKQVLKNPDTQKKTKVNLEDFFFNPSTQVLKNPGTPYSRTKKKENQTISSDKMETTKLKSGNENFKIKDF